MLQFTAVSLSGTTSIQGNTVLRCGSVDMNWKFGLGGMWFYGLDGGGTMTGDIEIQDNVVQDSPQAALFVIGNTVSGLTFNNLTVDGAGTFVLQFRGLKGPEYTMVEGDAKFSGVKATGVKYHSIYSCMGNATQQFKITDGGGNTGWLHSCSGGGSCASAEPNTTCTGGQGGSAFCEHCGFPSGVPNSWH